MMNIMNSTDTTNIIKMTNVKMIKIQAAYPTHRQQPLQLQVQQDREHGDVRERQLQSASSKRAGPAASAHISAAANSRDTRRRWCRSHAGHGSCDTRH